MKKIVVIGPESTGKSTLCRQLADHYKTLWVPEYAREYLLQHGTQYHYDDLLTIARGQVALEDRYAQQLLSRAASGGTDALKADPPLFIDTDMYVMKVWCEFVFNNCHTWILQQIAQRTYDYYLLCNIDLPWTKDELREYPDIESRRQLYQMYRDLLIQQSTPWSIISGREEQRLHSAITVVNTLYGR